MSPYPVISSKPASRFKDKYPSRNCVTTLLYHSEKRQKEQQQRTTRVMATAHYNGKNLSKGLLVNMKK